jgi:hypothetical protein
MAEGFGGKTCLGEPPDDGEMFVVWGQLWTALTAIPRAMKQGRPFIHIDNGYVQPARGSLVGYYRLTYNGMSPVMLRDAPETRVRVQMKPWRSSNNQGHVLLALPGAEFGRAIGLEMSGWIRESRSRIRRYTNRLIKIRERKASSLLEQDLSNSWALVTHSSNVAVDAVLSGVPVFVEKTNPAAPVGNFDLTSMDWPEMPSRGPWFNSLMAQQYTIDEMRNGFASHYMSKVIAQKESH